MARRRTRVRRRAHGRRGVHALGAVALAGLGYWLATGPLLTVSDVRLSGYPGSDAAATTTLVREAAERGGSLLVPPAGAIRRAAQADPWVKDVIIHRDLPTGLVVQVVAARPVAVGIPRAGRAMLVSGDGRSMGPVPRGTTLPRIAVPVAGALPLGARLPAASRAPVAFVAALRPEDGARVRDLATRHGLVIGKLAGGPEIRAGTPGNMAAKAAALSAVLAQVGEDEQRAARYIDVSVPDHPALGGPEADPAITRGTREQASIPRSAADGSPTAPATPSATATDGSPVTGAADAQTAPATAEAGSTSTSTTP